ncbi:MAG: thioredoxin-disulfide reductase [Bdellovibrionaceae bacterium]|nr:thioredoxin-disulfide reductase [Pseudobdellovibrionaceae bacterium]|tara:strand:+ start:87687 stop:88610 length:924 start_codon:yes stop_codon:yes gene_type:complete
MEKVIIIGSGPAGYTSAIYTARANLNPLMIAGEEIGGQLMLTTEVENYPGFADGITGPEMMDVLRKQAERFGTRIVPKKVTKVDFSARPYKVWIGEEMHETQSVIISTGATAKLLDIESEQTFWGRGISACATCDGAFFRNVDVAVIGGGDTAMEEALFLTRFANKVYVVHRRDEFRASKIMSDRVKAHEKIEILWNKETLEYTGDQMGLKGMKLKDTVNGEESEIKVEGCFVAIGHKPNTDIFGEQLEKNDTGYLVTKPDSTYTNVEGVFAAGDVQDHVYRQAITAAGSGCMAAIDCERWLEEQNF